MSDRGANGKPTAGVSNPTVAVAIVALLVLIGIITVFLRIYQTQQDDFHKSQEATAYKYTEMKSARDATRTRCETHASNLAAIKIWAEQNKIKPPPDYLVTKDCVILSTSEIQKEQ